jgi:phosphatidylserine/phosphatidylglycerophosphate/cardiolipin synthase-like enzyme
MINFLMKRAPIIVTVLALGLSAILFAEKSNLQEKQPTWEIYFSPRGGCTEAIIGHLENAKSSVLIQAYSFTSAPIAKAILNANKRKVRVEVILDKSQETSKYSVVTFLLNQGVPVWIDRRHAAAHNKVMIIDGETVITGSFNFTTAAEENNAENLLIVRDAELARAYMKNFEDHKKHAVKKDQGA